jgi:hypothetical protein
MRRRGVVSAWIVRDMGGRWVFSLLPGYPLHCLDGLPGAALPGPFPLLAELATITAAHRD